MIWLVASILAVTSSDKAVYDAVVRSVYRDLHGIPAIRIFVADRTVGVTSTRLEKLASETGTDTGETETFARIRSHDAYANMLARSDIHPIARLKRTTLVRTDPRKLRCEGANWELSRDVAVHFGTPGYSRDGTEAAVFATIRDCISSANSVFLLKRTGTRWRIEAEACLACSGE